VSLKLWLSLAAAALAAFAFAPSAFAAPGDTTRVSDDSAGNQGDNYSLDDAISADGRYVAFSSRSSNLVPGDTNGEADIFVKDRQTGATERVSVDSGGNQASGASLGQGLNYDATISADGRFVGFASAAANLVPGDTNGAADVFVHDRQTGATERVSIDSAGNQENDGPVSDTPLAINGDGRFVAFESQASNLVPGDTNGASDVFVHDRQTGGTERVSVDSAGNQATSHSQNPAISGDGRFVSFNSGASNLVAGDTNGTRDIFVKDRQTGTTERVNVDSAGNQAEGGSFSFSVGVGNPISSDGRFVGFASDASNLVPGDTNGTFDSFLHDRQTGTTERVSVDSAGNQGNGDSYHSSVSADGRFVGFTSSASNLVSGDTNDAGDVFVKDRQTGTTERVSLNSSGEQASGGSSFYPAISADGSVVAFLSDATNLVPGDTNDVTDTFVHERPVAPPADNSASEEAPAGGTVATNSTTSADDPVGSSVTTPVAGTVTIDEGSTTTADPSGYSLLGHEVQITAPDASAADPLVIQFVLDSSILPPGTDASTVQVFRNGVAIADCAPAAGTSASPDPCIADRASAAGGGIAITVRTSHASTWNFGLHAAYAFQGFISPISAPPTLNPAQAGSTVTLRFKLGGNQGLGILASSYPRSHKISCDSAANDQGDDAQTSGSLSYDPKSQRYSYAWKTSKAWAKPAICRQFVLRLNDGSAHRANFQFRK
jgi:WD40-like Beta Propeller Repeat